MNTVLKKLQQNEGLEYVLNIDEKDLISLGWDTGYGDDYYEGGTNHEGLSNYSILFDTAKKQFVMHAEANNNPIFITDEEGMGGINGVMDLLQFGGNFR